MKEFNVDKLSKRVKKIRLKFKNLHEECGCYYGRGDNKKPYVFHLDLVAAEAIRFIHLIPKEFREEVLVGIYGHDSLEDCNISPNDMVKIVGNKYISPLYGKGLAATMIYNMTDELGWNRKERAEKTYPKIKSYDYSIFGKLCDRLANVRYSSEQASNGDKDTMYYKYCDEYKNFEKVLYVDDTYDEMWNELAGISGHSFFGKKKKRFSGLRNFFGKYLQR